MLRSTLTCLLASLCTCFALQAQMVITGVMDGPLSGGTPKVFEITVLEDIADMTLYGIGVANNGGGSDGQEFTFDAGTAVAGDVIYVCYEGGGGSANPGSFLAFMGFEPTIIDGIANVNGDDPFELFCDGVSIDVYGDLADDGTGLSWEYLDGWAYSNADRCPSTTFNPGDWTFSGANALDGQTTNDAATPYPAGTYTIADVAVCDEVSTCILTSAGVSASACDGATDEFSITIDPATNATGTSYTYTVNGGTASAAIAYGTSSDIGPFTADGTTTYDIVVTDSDDITCTVNGPTVTAPAACLLAPCTGGILITGMMEGNGDNKCVEIYNETAAAIDLSGYSLNIYSNGSQTVSTNSRDLSGTIGAGEYFLICDNGVDGAGLGIVPDLTLASFLAISGDDAFAIFDGTVNTDVFGVIGEDPGNGWAGLTTGSITQNSTWCRTMPATCLQGAVGFDPDAWGTTTGVLNDVSCFNSGTPDACMITASGLDVSACDPADDTFTITIDPTAALGSASGYMYALNGATAVGPTAYGTPTVLGPFIADGATTYDVVISDNDDTACMMMVPTQTAPAACSGGGDPCSGELLISVVMEGGNNKCVEIYNASGGTIDLSLYRITIYANANTMATNTITLAGSLDAGEYYLICHSQVQTTLGLNADLVAGLNFNGNDAIAITDENLNIVDAFGQIGGNPSGGWIGQSSTESTESNTWVRSDFSGGCSDGTEAFDPDILYNTSGVLNDIAGFSTGQPADCDANCGNYPWGGE